MYRAFLFFLAPYRRRFVLLAAIMLVASILEGFTIAAFFPMFLAITRPEDSDQLPRLLQAMVDVGRLLPVNDSVVAASILLALVLSVRTVAVFVREVLIASTGGHVLFDLRQNLMQKYASLPYQFFASKKHGTLLYQAVVAPASVSLILQRIPQGVAEALKIIAIGTVLVMSFPTATAVFGVLGLLFFVGARRLATTVGYDTGAQRSVAYEEQMDVAQQLFSGIRHLHVYGVETHWLSRFEKANDLYRQLYVRFQTWVAVPRNVMELGAVLLLVGAIIVGRLTRADSFDLWLPTLGLLALATLQLMPSVTALGRMGMETQGARRDLERLHGVMMESYPSLRGGTLAFAGLKDGIEFDGVSFHYESRPLVLRDFSVVLPRDRVTAIVGASGVGKTTIVNLILGLLEPAAGTIRVDGVPLQSYDSASWLRHVGFVSQDPFIFHDTIRENIRFGRPGFSDEQVISAARLAHAHDFISEMPDGYDSMVGDRGAKLSGGQQQRLAIARAALDDPEILVLDEPTSALDPASERLVHEALLEATKHRTVIMVTHDERVLDLVDHIVTLVPRADDELTGASVEPRL